VSTTSCRSFGNASAAAARTKPWKQAISQRVLVDILRSARCATDSRSRTCDPPAPADRRVASIPTVIVKPRLELDAIEPNRLRSLVQETIELHLPADQFAVLKAAEESERDIITRLVRKIARKRLR
jgi:hypothetical protein